MTIYTPIDKTSAMKLEASVELPRIAVEVH